MKCACIRTGHIFVVIIVSPAHLAGLMHSARAAHTSGLCKEKRHCCQFCLYYLCSIREMICICIEQDREWVCPKGNVVATIKRYFF